MVLKIYTRTGDRGMTGLFSGERVSKASPRVEAYGGVDELNAFIGLARSSNRDRRIDGILKNIQQALFKVGADLATPDRSRSGRKVSRTSSEDVKWLEETIDSLEESLTSLTRFVLPSGSETAALLHVCRAVCRRAERRLVAAMKREKINDQVLIYVNRLSDLLFVLARHANLVSGVKEDYWEH